jgi:hypothetical protein
MIVYDFEQGSPEWCRARCGVVTASHFSDILSDKTLKPLKADAYLNRLAAETVLGTPLDESIRSGFVERGIDMEAEAVRFYEFSRGVDTDPVGFCLRDDKRVGCSPDRLIGTDGGLEIKVPAAHTHVSYMLDNDELVAAYRGQVQGALWLTGRKWWDIVSYHPDLPSVIVRVEPDAQYAGAIGPAIDAFLARLDAAVAKVRPLVVEAGREKSWDIF